MKKLLLLLITTITFISCSETEEAKKIQWTSSSEIAVKLFNEFNENIEKSRWEPDTQEKLMDSLKILDPNFVFAKLRDNFGTNNETRDKFLNAYSERNNVSDIEKRIIEAEYERRINGNQIKRDAIFDKLIEDYPDYYELRIWSGDIKNQALQDPKAAQKRWEEALEINPKSFEAYVNLAFLHFPTGNNFTMLANDERDLDVAKDFLSRGSKIYPKSSRWSRFLGNVYRAEGNFEKAEIEYQKSLDIIADYEAGSDSNVYANSLLMMGHVNTFQGQYDSARDFYDQGIAISNDWWKVNMTEMKAHTYMYQKNFADAIFLLSEMQNQIDDMDEEEQTKNNWRYFTEFTKFLAFGHSQKQEETLASLDKMEQLSATNTNIRLENSINEDQRERILTGTKKNNISNQIWYNILFGNYEDARTLLVDFKTISESQLGYNLNAMVEFYKLSGYLNLMEGDPQESINSYNNLSKEIMSDDSYHVYFLALAKKGVGEIEESNQIFSELANDNFATWQNAIVKNLAKAQIEVNL